MLRQVEREAESNFFQFLKFMQTYLGWIWVALVTIAVFIVFRPDHGQVTVHTQFLLVCFACLAMIPDFGSDTQEKK
jgi:hypothetical protein